MLGGLPEHRDAATHWPFTSPAACSIFNVSQLTAGLAGSLARNATHASAAAWQAHASCCWALWPPNQTLWGQQGAYCAGDWTGRYWGDQSGICISLEDCASAGSGWLLPLLPLRLLAAASAGQQEPRCPPASEQRAERRAAGCPHGCLLRVRTRAGLRCRALYWPGRLSCGSDWLICSDSSLVGLWDCSLLLNIKK